MSTNTRHQKKGIDLPTHADHIGVDGDGRDHYYSGYENTIYVLKDGKRLHVEAFDDVTGIAQWVEGIARKYNWRELRYRDGTTADFVTEKLDEVTDA